MDIFICTLLFNFMIFIDDVQSMNQQPPLNEKQKPRGNQVVITYRNGLWYLDKRPYGEGYSTTIIPFLPPRPPLCDLQISENQLRKIRKDLVKLARRPLLIPDIHEGDLMYRRGIPIGRVTKSLHIESIDPSDKAGFIAPVPMNGDTIVLNGPHDRWFTLLNGSRVQGPKQNSAAPGYSPLIN